MGWRVSVGWNVEADQWDLRVLTPHPSPPAPTAQGASSSPPSLRLLTAPPFDAPPALPPAAFEDDDDEDLV